MNERLDVDVIHPDIIKHTQESGLFDRFKSRSRKVAALAAIATIGVLGIVDNTGERKAGHRMISPQEIEYVDYTFDHTGQGIDIEPSSGAKLEIKTDNTTREYLDKVASECGLTLINPQDYLNELKDSDSFDEALGSLNEYVNNFGFQFKTIDKLDDIDIDNQLDGRAILDSNYIKEFVMLYNFKETAGTIMQALGYTPVEYIKASKLNEVRLLRGFGEGRGTTVGYPSDSNAKSAIVDMKNNRINFAISSFSPYKGPALFFHEVGHLIDSNQMEGTPWIDPEYASLNPQGFVYGNGQRYEDNKNAFVDKYASWHIQEDKGLIYQNFIVGPRLAYSDKKIIQEKTRLLVARLEHDIPNISKYYAEYCNVPAINSPEY
jgi:hypothetical protein